MLSLRSMLPSLLLALAVPVAAQEASRPAAGAPQEAPARAATAPEAGAPAAAAPTDAEIIAAQKPSYPLTTCLVSDEALGGSMGAPIDYVYEGRFMQFCCLECKFNVEKEPAKFLAKLDAAVIAAQKASYPLTTCVMSGEALGRKPVDLVYGTRFVKVCCNDCKADFLKDPAPALAKIDVALIAAQSADYPLATCPVSGEKLEDPVDVLYGVQLVKFCCKQCAGEFRANPDKYLAMVAAARPAADAKPAAPAAGDGAAHHEDKPAPRGN